MTIFHILKYPLKDENAFEGMPEGIYQEYARRFRDWKIARGNNLGTEYVDTKPQMKAILKQVLLEWEDK